MCVADGWSDRRPQRRLYQEDVGCSTKLHDVTGQVIVAALWTYLWEGRLRISHKGVSVLVVILYKFQDSNFPVISNSLFMIDSVIWRYETSYTTSVLMEINHVIVS